MNSRAHTQRLSRALKLELIVIAVLVLAATIPAGASAFTSQCTR